VHDQRLELQSDGKRCENSNNRLFDQELIPCTTHLVVLVLVVLVWVTLFKKSVRLCHFKSIELNLTGLYIMSACGRHSLLHLRFIK